jgi:GAF domain-containing protein
VAAIVDAALTTGAADFCDLQLYDPATASLRMEAVRGFSRDFATFFATVDGGQQTACAAALHARHAVLVDDVDESPVFAGSPALEQLHVAGSRAVRSYPLLAASGEVFAVLSLHYSQTAPRHGMPDLVAAGATHALQRIRSGRSTPG